MPDNSKNYDYFMVEGFEVKKLIDSAMDVEKSRKKIIDRLKEDAGSVGVTFNSGWGEKGDQVRLLWWWHDHNFPCQMTIKGSDYLGDKKVICGHGKGNTADGRKFSKEINRLISEANEKLKELPCFESFIINHYGVMRTGFGSQSQSLLGISLLSTYAGTAPGRSDCLMFAIPSHKDDKEHGSITIPESFVKITYGQFYDIVNKD